VLVRRYLSCFRYRDILMLQGSPLLGAAFALEEISPGRLGALLVFAAASVLLVAHIFVLNDWAGLDADLNDAHRVAGAFATKGVDRRAIRRLWIALLALSLALFGLLGVRPLAIALAIAGLSFLYSLPAAPAKGVPVLGSTLHLGGGILHFLLGYSLWKAIDERGVALALFFGLTFAAGHLNQEVRDFESDVRNGIRTNAVAFGKTPTFIAGLVVFTLAYAQLVALAAGGIIAGWLAALALFYPLHLYWSLKVAAAGLSFDRIRRLQTRYRAIFAVIGAAMLAALVISPRPPARTAKTLRVISAWSQRPGLNPRPAAWKARRGSPPRS
jgi:4-hydroxybenzoate polyprenyltransferase